MRMRWMRSPSSAAALAEALKGPGAGAADICNNPTVKPTPSAGAICLRGFSWDCVAQEDQRHVRKSGVYDCEIHDCHGAESAQPLAFENFRSAAAKWGLASGPLPRHERSPGVEVMMTR
jgi:hypothetical protein